MFHRLPKTLLLLGLLSCLPRMAHAADFQADLDVVGGTYRMFTLGTDPVVVRVTLSSANGQAQQVAAHLMAKDIMGQTVPAFKSSLFVLDLPADGTKVAKDIPFEVGPGYFQISGSFGLDTAPVTKWTEAAVIPPPHPGLRPESFFASNTSGIKTGDDLKFLRMIGMKIQRVHFQPRLAGKVPDVSTGAALPLDFKDQDKAWAAAKAGDTWVLPIAGYAFEGTRSKLAEQTAMYGPPRDDAEFVNTWEQILRHYPEVTTYEFWNEPWIFGWTWAGSGAEYRRLQEMWCKMALRVNPHYRIIAGNSSMFTEDHIEPDPASWKGLLQGTSHHPYSYSTGQPTLRAGDQTRTTDYGMVVTRRMGLPYYYLTEGGTEYAPPAPEGATAATTAPAPEPGFEPKNNVENGYKIVQYYVHAALVGAYMGNAQWGIGYGPGWTRSNTSFAVMTHFLEDRPIVADIWPSHELIWGAIFANPRHVTPAVRALPRASELSSRWHVPIPTGYANDPTKVAVIWSVTGRSNAEVDTGGTLTIANPQGLTAYDMTGRVIPAHAGKLTVPFNQDPVYITTDSLDVVTLRQRIAGARLQKLTPVNLYALSLLRPAQQAQSLAVRLENQLNRIVTGTLSLQRIGQTTTISTRFTIPAGKLAEVPVTWPGALTTPQNQYGVMLTARTDAGTVTKRQIIAAAQFVRRSIQVDGNLNDWRGITPVLLDSDRLKNGVDMTQYLLNPNLSKPTGTGAAQRIVARIYTAYDARNVYLAAAVHEDKLTSTAGQPATRGRGAEKVTLPYRTGMPDGLDHIRNCGDSFAFAFGFRDRVPGWGRQMDDPYAWKGHFYDTDYHYVAHISTDGPQLVRQWGPNTTRRTAYQTEVVPGYGPVPGAHIVIKRDEAAKLSIYELSIPRSELTLFDPAKGRCRFGFMLPNDEKLGDGGALQWSEAAGVFDHWRSSGSFGPSWMQVLPCQTFFGINP